MRSIILLVLSLSIAQISFAQTELRPSIGSYHVPNDSESIAAFPSQPYGFDSLGVKANDIAYDFTLYDLENNPVTLSKILSQKPVLLFCGSYSCPRFRYAVPLINQIAAKYKGRINIYIVYACEAHPALDPSPYQGESAEEIAQTDSENIALGIIYRQPVTYGQRKAIAKDMLRNMQINAPLLFDGPHNEWNLHFGPSPAYAVLIGTDGIVKTKQSPLYAISDLPDEVEKLVGDSSASVDTGSFSVALTGADTVQGPAGSTLAVTDEIINNSGANAIVNINRISTTMPMYWQTSLCIDACYSSQVTSASVQIAPHSKQEIKIYFYTDSIPSTGSVALQFSNMNRVENYAIQSFYARTSQRLAVPSSAANSDESIGIFPNPAQNKISLETPLAFSKIRFIDIYGKKILEYPNANSYNIAALPSGMYFIELISESGQIIGSDHFIKE